MNGQFQMKFDETTGDIKQPDVVATSAHEDEPREQQASLTQYADEREALSIWEGVEVISVYTRVQAIEDGVLVDVSETAREAGITFPVAMTRTVFDDYVTPDPRSESWGQSIAGRLWDVLMMLRFAIQRTGGATDQIDFTVIMIMKERQRRNIRLKALCGPGDDMEPIITIMMPNED